MPSGGVYEVHAVTTVFLPGKGFLESSKHDWMDCMKNYIVLSTPQRRVAKVVRCGQGGVAMVKVSGAP